VTRQIFRGLGALHAHNITHRDVRPTNILINDSGVVKVSDFGLARYVSSTRSRQQMSFVGNERYMSPEQIACQPYDTKVDVWAAGLTIAELSFGRFPRLVSAASQSISTLSNSTSSERIAGLICPRGSSTSTIPPSAPPSAPPVLSSSTSSEYNAWQETWKIVLGRVAVQWNANTPLDLEDFVAQCLIQDPLQRPSVVQLLQHPFITENVGHLSDREQYVVVAQWLRSTGVPKISKMHSLQKKHPASQK